MARKLEKEILPIWLRLYLSSISNTYTTPRGDYAMLGTASVIVRAPKEHSNLVPVSAIIEFLECPVRGYLAMSTSRSRIQVVDSETAKNFMFGINYHALVEAVLESSGFITEVEVVEHGVKGVIDALDTENNIVVEIKRSRKVRLYGVVQALIYASLIGADGAIVLTLYDTVPLPKPTDDFKLFIDVVARRLYSLEISDVVRIAARMRAKGSPLCASCRYYSLCSLLCRSLLRR